MSELRFARTADGTRIRYRVEGRGGSVDLATTPAIAGGLRAGIPTARAEVIENAGHLSNVEQPEAFNRTIAFLP